MQRWWILPVLGAWLVSAAVVHGQGSGHEGAQQGETGEAGDSALDRAQFPSRPALGEFQPTDIGGAFQPTGSLAGEDRPEGRVMADEGLSAQPQQPAALAPPSSAGPIRRAGEPPQPNGAFQGVAPAQFQTPIDPKSRAEPQTTIVPAGAAPAFQPAPPAGQPLNPPPNPNGERSAPQNLAQSLYRQSIAAPAAGTIAGQPLSLEQALARRVDRTRYAEFVKGYWRLAQLLADYHDAVQGAAELAQLPTPQAALGQAMLQSARAAAEAEMRHARVEAVSAQWALAEQMSGDSAPPLPQDAPLMTAYKSKFDAVFAGRTPPAAARRLHETFAPQLAVIEARAAAVAAAENAFAALADAYAAGQADVSGVLREHQRLQTARREFLRSVYDYNAAIADYAYLAAGPNRTPDTIASMLVERPRPTSPPAAQANLIAP